MQAFPLLPTGMYTCSHEYHVACSDLVIVRWCSKCGETHMLERYVGGSFPITWEKVREP